MIIVVINCCYCCCYHHYHLLSKKEGWCCCCRSIIVDTRTTYVFGFIDLLFLEMISGNSIVVINWRWWNDDRGDIITHFSVNSNFLSDFFFLNIYMNEYFLRSNFITNSKDGIKKIVIVVYHALFAGKKYMNTIFLSIFVWNDESSSNWYL